MATSRLASAPAWTELGTLGGPGGWGATDICWGPLGGEVEASDNRGPLGVVRGSRRHLGMATPRALMLSGLSRCRAVKGTSLYFTVLF